MGRTRVTTENSYHAIFADMVQYTDDEEWKTMLLNMSNNVFISSYSYTNNNLLYRNGKKVEKERLSSDPKEAFNQVQLFFKKRKFKTESEIQAKTDELTLRLEKGWNAVKSENMQKVYLHEFVDKYSKENNLPKTAEARLREEVFINAIEKRYNNKCVTFENGHIYKLNDYTLKSKGAPKSK